MITDMLLYTSKKLLFLTVSVDTWHDKSCVLLLLLLLLTINIMPNLFTTHFPPSH